LREKLVLSKHVGAVISIFQTLTFCLDETDVKKEKFNSGGRLPEPKADMFSSCMTILIDKDCL